MPLAASILLATGFDAQAQSGDAVEAAPSDFWSKFRDEQDNAFDVSNWLLSRGGFLLVPTLVTEPALGYGVAAGCLFVQKHAQPATGLAVPPDLYVLGGMWTADGSWALAAGFSGNFAADRLRAQSAVLYGDLDLEFFGAGDRLDQSIQYDISGLFLLEDARIRLWSTRAFAGTRYLFTDTEADFNSPPTSSGITPEEFASRNAGLSAVVSWDSRDNIFTPNRGIEAEALATRFDEAFGGDFEYWKYDLTGYGWMPLGSRLVLGARADGSFIEGGAPFYGLPYVLLRGVPAAKYQGKIVTTGEIEARVRVHRRWSVIGFAGLGGAAQSFEALDEAKGVPAGGAGFRYFLARQLDLHAGLDFAWSKEDFAFYIQVGDAWR